MDMCPETWLHSPPPSQVAAIAGGPPQFSLGVIQAFDIRHHGSAVHVRLPAPYRTRRLRCRAQTHRFGKGPSTVVTCATRRTAQQPSNSQQDDGSLTVAVMSEGSSVPMAFHRLHHQLRASDLEDSNRHVANIPTCLFRAQGIWCTHPCKSDICLPSTPCPAIAAHAYHSLLRHSTIQLSHL
ncbi:hypothetical protein T440DRAFT_505 [Plenodomus tracheiphilus IPT5]|uniref:Uncharacterized protein n=1 Tax=Plenodomus tracheiphilus IPT5 TaxID=1408161 RepID=A0A6A7BPP3_9PLEO|nr:hypothetical protein T440DRAFT_505 [Plenodomus tracheiphilus IPT5]